MLTHHNVVPQAQLGNQTPLELFRYQVANLPIRLLPPHGLRMTNPFTYSEIVSVKQILSERRRPHINFLYVRYVGEALDGRTFNQEKVRIECDYRDIRILRVYSLRGEFLGEVYPQGGWLRFPHSITTRKAIKKQNRKMRLSIRDPLGEYFSHILDKRDQPSMATELMRVTREFGFDNLNITKLEGAIDTIQKATTIKTIEPESRISSWYSNNF